MWVSTGYATGGLASGFRRLGFFDAVSGREITRLNARNRAGDGPVTTLTNHLIHSTGWISTI
jgi:hypothetical protein